MNLFLTFWLVISERFMKSPLVIQISWSDFHTFGSMSEKKDAHNDKRLWKATGQNPDQPHCYPENHISHCPFMVCCEFLQRVYYLSIG